MRNQVRPDPHLCGGVAQAGEMIHQPWPIFVPRHRGDVAAAKLGRRFKCRHQGCRIEVERQPDVERAEHFNAGRGQPAFYLPYHNGLAYHRLNIARRGEKAVDTRRRHKPHDN